MDRRGYPLGGELTSRTAEPRAPRGSDNSPKARILAQQARTDETLQLIARGDITAARKSFKGHIDELAALLGAGPPAAADGVAKWTASHQKQMEAYQGGDYPAAVAQAIGPDPGASAAQFTAVESACATRSSKPATTLRDRVATAGTLAGVESNGDARADGGRCGRRLSSVCGRGSRSS